jgi:hypothetical protein
MEMPRKSIDPHLGINKSILFGIEPKSTAHPMEKRIL